MTINKAVLMIGKAPVRYLMKKLHEKQEEIIVSNKPLETEIVWYRLFVAREVARKSLGTLLFNPLQKGMQ